MILLLALAAVRLERLVGGAECFLAGLGATAGFFQIGGDPTRPSIDGSTFKCIHRTLTINVV